MVTGYKATRHRKLTAGQKQANRILAAGCAPVEHGFAHLKNWRILTVTDDQHRRLPRSTSPSTPESPHASPSDQRVRRWRGFTQACAWPRLPNTDGPPVFPSSWKGRNPDAVTPICRVL
ncbi:hypothetical protein [Streptomyces roseoverticillatus]|uniref:Transposase n=1 Tax=Streptomyces roseoverticillatus TaxID=66429 RepID=A0ABV3J1J4_9ACTN